MRDSGVILLDDGGRLRAATPAAERLLARGGDLEPSLRSLAGRVALDGPAVLMVPLPEGGRLCLTAARAGRELTVVIEAEDAPAVDLEPFTPREREVLEHVLHGLPTKRIARVMQISPWTVQDHLQSMYAKAGVCSRGELVARSLGAQQQTG